MTNIIIGLLIGGFVGALFGAFVVALCVAAGKADRQIETDELNRRLTLLDGGGEG